ncbi:MAG TPA: amino acid adenylation domain-containing protein [Casimicrobiaceae bacterium]|nr:amino acid adenylation domain-containing protein [Casimicrobiaceae bacterium]
MDSYPLSPMQQGMLFHDLAAGGSGAYVQHAICDFRERVDIALLEEAWHAVIERHAILRTRFRIEGIEEPLQQVLREADARWHHEDWRDVAPGDVDARFEAYIDSDRRRDFDPGVAPLARLATFRLADAHWRLLCSYHHALLDGRGVRIVLRDALDVLDALSAGRNAELPAVQPFRAFIEWLGTRDSLAARDYWQRALPRTTTPTALLCRRPQPTGAATLEGYAAREICLSAEATEALSRLARANGLSLNTLLVGAWAQLLSRYSGEDAVSFGVTLALRGAGPATFREMVGPLINTVPIRIELAHDMPLREWLRALRSQWLEMRTHAWASPTRIRQWAAIPPEVPLFSSLVVYEHALLDPALHAERSNWTTRRFGRRSGASHPLTLVAFGEPRLSLKLVYERALFDSETIGRMLDHVRTLLEGTLDGLDLPLGTQPLLSAAEERRMLVDWNDTGRRFPAAACVHVLFERQVERTPDAVAVEGPDGLLSYRELNDRANQVARYLQRSGVGRGTLVGVCMERTPDVAVAILGILKAGGAYLPLDPGHPLERLQYVVGDAGLSTLITSRASAHRLTAIAASLALVDVRSDSIERESTANLSSTVGLRDPAYAIYTSGSTGRPKGSVIEHRGLANLTLANVERYGYGPGERRTQFVSIASDVHVGELFPALASGATVVFLHGTHAPSITEFVRELERLRITITGIPSAYWHEWVLQMSRNALAFPSSLRVVLSGMDSARPDLLALWRREARGRARWFNVYGPSEASGTATSYEADLATDEALSNVPIGRPLPNVRIYLLDAHARPVPLGIPGEICIGGHAVGRGYLNQPVLTAERFIRDPFGDSEESRLYRTGDVGRYLPDGNIEFLGRIDKQIKIRGYRVEPAEVEAALLELPGVRAAAVVVRGDPPDSRRLIAYVVAADGAHATSTDLRAALRRTLPEFMLPAAIAILDALPLTPSGKIDLTALPDPRSEAAAGGQPHELPRTQVEHELSSLWEKLLQSRVGIWDNFFDVGGDSLRALQLLDQIQTDFGVNIDLSTLFGDAANIAGMASRIEADRMRSPSDTAIPVRRRVPST